MIRAGAMRHQIRIEVRSSSVSASGGQSIAWSTYATVRAEMTRTPGRELVAAAQVAARAPVLFRIRYLAGLSPAMRVVCENRVFNIISVTDQGGRKEELVLTTEEYVDETVGEDGGPYVPPIQTLAAENVTVAAISGLEATNAQAAFAELQGDVTALTTATGNADARLDVVETDIDALESADASIQADIEALEAADAAEASARATSDGTLQGNIDAEATARADADATLQAAITALQNALANYVALTGNQTIGGVKTFSSAPVFNGGVNIGGGQNLLWQGVYGFTVSGTVIYTLAAGLGLNSVGISAKDLFAKDSIEVTDPGDGLVLKSPAGTRYRVTVSNAGALVVTAA